MRPIRRCLGRVNRVSGTVAAWGVTIFILFASVCLVRAQRLVNGCHRNHEGLTMLSGYKTYIFAGLLVANNLAQQAGLLTPDVTDLLNWLLGGGALAAVRVGMKTEAGKR